MAFLWVVAVFITHAFQPPLTAISSFLFKRHEKITLEEGLAWISTDRNSPNIGGKIG
jgi:hypothetical protein